MIKTEYDYLREQDIETVLDIERESNPFPWTLTNFKDCLVTSVGSSCLGVHCST